MIAWVLNLDADLELAAGKAYSPTRGALAAMAPHRERLAVMLARADDLVVREEPELALVSPRGLPVPNAPSATVGLAFCPTPRALALLRKLEITPAPHPSFAVLRRVNGRAFCAELGQTLEGATFATSLDEALAVLAEPPRLGRQWRAKRAFGMAGRGQRPIAPGAVSEADRAFLRASIERDGGLQIEPEVEIARELAMHGHLDATGAVRLGRLVEQRCDRSGQWLESRPLDADLPALRAEAQRVAEALHAAGYFGPFGVDAYEYRRTTNGELGLNPRSEINARYSMGYSASGIPISATLR